MTQQPPAVDLQYVIMPVFDVTDLPELVRDTQLDATVGTSTTIHTSVEIPHPRHEEWRRERFLSSGGSGHVWLEKCISGLQPDSPDLRAVKKIALSSDSGILDCIRELEALAKFSQPKVIADGLLGHSRIFLLSDRIVLLFLCEITRVVSDGS